MSSSPVLVTKLRPPVPRPGLVVRPRLTEVLDAGRALTLVSAPAGFGKTTLLAAWLADKTGVAWVSLDERDNDPERFLAHVAASLRLADPTLDLPAEQVMAALVNGVALSEVDLVLALDDYHVIT
ncbi:hypothetical protein [Lentzea sp. NPDC051838]|uniref:hypothetical protein n=1 Tax=Lentzea sp. NPDC051838 TaxID=3154849 RepID=UPI00342E2F87